MTKVIDSFRGEYKWLSNFFGGPVQYEGRIYPSSEHAYQAAKSTDPDVRMEIQSAKSPREAKKLGMKVELRPGWDDMRVDVMRNILWSKFGPDSALASDLLCTGDSELIEGNDWGDTFWGQVDGVGENWLGKLLMEIREELKRRKDAADS